MTVGQVMTFTLEDYVAHVGSTESIDSWGDTSHGGMEELRRGPYRRAPTAWYEMATANGSHPTWDVTDDTYYQMMCGTARYAEFWPAPRQPQPVLHQLRRTTHPGPVQRQ